MLNASTDNSYNELPAIGERGPSQPDADGQMQPGSLDPHQYLAKFCNGLAIEATQIRAVHTEDHAASLNLYLYGDENGRDVDRSLINRVQGAVNQAAIELIKTPPVLSLEPACVGDDGTWYIRTPVTVPPDQDPQSIPPYMLGLQPIPDDILIAAATDPNGQPVLGPDMQPVLAIPQENRVCVNLDLVTDYYQPILDLKNEQARTDNFFTENVWLTLIYGFEYSLFQLDPDEFRFTLDNIPALQWYPDPTAADIDKMAYLGLDWILDAQAAKRRWPESAKFIDENASRTIDYAPNNIGYSRVWVDVTFQRPIVTMRTFWLRNQVRPLTEDEAIRGGHVQERMVPDETQMGAPGEDGAGPAPGRKTRDRLEILRKAQRTPPQLLEDQMEMDWTNRRYYQVGTQTPAAPV